MTNEDIKQIRLLYLQIQKLCLKKLSQSKYKKEDTNAYSNILNFCFDLSKKATFLQKTQTPNPTGKDYIANLFEEGYKQGYNQINCNTKQIDLILYNSQAHFNIWQPKTNPYEQLRPILNNNKKKLQPVDTIALFKQIKKILNQNTQEIIREIEVLLNHLKKGL